MSFATGRALPALLAVAIAAATTPAQPKPAAIPEQLAQRVSVDPFDGKFGDALKLLADKYKLSLTVDPSLTAEAASNEDVSLPNKSVKLPKLSNVRLGTVLRLVCDQVNAMYLADPDHIRIVRDTYGLIEAEVWKQSDPADPNAEESPLPLTDRYKYRPAIKRALVNASFKAKPLAEILDAIADATGANVVLAPQVGEPAKQPLTARFANAPVDVAVRALCEMTDLGVIDDGNVLVVTTKDRAAARAKADAEKRKARHAEAALVNFGGGLGGGPPPPAQPELSGELAKLKEQNEQLKKQLDEIQKLLKK